MTLTSIQSCLQIQSSLLVLLDIPFFHYLAFAMSLTLKLSSLAIRTFSKPIAVSQTPLIYSPAAEKC